CVMICLSLLVIVNVSVVLHVPQRYGGLRPVPCWLCTGRAGRNPPVMRCPVSSYRLLIGPFALPLSPDIVRAATPFFPRLFRTFPVIALAWVLVPVTGRLPVYCPSFPRERPALFYSEFGTPKNPPACLPPLDFVADSG